MKSPQSSPSKESKSSKPEKERHEPISKTNANQLSVQFRLLDGSTHTWPYSHLCHHSLRGGRLVIVFSEHIVTVHGRHLQEADDGLRLRSLVWLEETGTRRRETLGEDEIPEDQPAIDSIGIVERKDD